MISGEIAHQVKEVFAIPGDKSLGAESLNVASAYLIVAAWWVKYLGKEQGAKDGAGSKEQGTEQGANCREQGAGSKGQLQGQGQTRREQGARSKERGARGRGFFF